MAKVMVYKILQADGQHYTTRMATREAIEALGLGFVPDEGSAIEIDDSLLGREHPGMTNTDFEPLRNFQLVGADLSIQYQNRELSIVGKGLPLGGEASFSDDKVTKIVSDFGFEMNIVLLDSSRDGTRFLLRLVVPMTSPSTAENVAITGVAVFVQNFNNKVGGAPPILQVYDARPLTGTMFA
jgi:hypothetical protein